MSLETIIAKQPIIDTPTAQNLADNPQEYAERFKFHVTCTRLKPEDPWTGRRGRITPEWVKSFVDDPANTVFYACGTNEMVEAVEHLVTHDLGLPKEQMKTEKWG